MKKIVKREKMKKELSQKKGKAKQAAPEPTTIKQSNGKPNKKPQKKRPVDDDEGVYTK